MNKTFSKAHAAIIAALHCGFLGLLMAGFGLTPAYAASPKNTVMVMGDSLSAGYGLTPNQGWVALLEKRLRSENSPWHVVNTSVSGETSAGGHARFASALQNHQPNVVVIALGANDGLRGLPLVQMKANLSAMIAAAKQANAKVLLIGMRMPPNYGPDYTQGFENTFRELAEQFRVSYLPFLLEPFASERAAFQADNLHPVAAAQPRLLAHVWPALAPLLR